MDHVPSQHQHDAGDANRHGHLRRFRRHFLAALALLALCGFVALGVWQLERRIWKLDLIARVDARIHAAPAALPPANVWSGLKPKDFEYRRVLVGGTYLPAGETLVQAVTERGPGFWVITPLRTAQGIVLINRGFVPQDRSSAAEARPASGHVTAVGLMRASEPGGGFLRRNDPAANRWYSRDVAAIARAKHLGLVAPFFIDAQGSANGQQLPTGGLTVIRFNNNHLIYALTWFGMACLCGFAAWRVLREGQR